MINLNIFVGKIDFNCLSNTESYSPVETEEDKHK